jgi:hypothetical protein
MSNRTYFVYANEEFASYLRWNLISHTFDGNEIIFQLYDDSDNKFFKLIQDFTIFMVGKN